MVVGVKAQAQPKYLGWVKGGWILEAIVDIEIFFFCIL